MARRPHSVLLAGVGAVCLFFACPVCAQQVTLGATRGLDFGRFVAGSGGAVTVDASGARSRTGGVILLNSANAGQAVFTVSSNGKGTNKSVVISLPPDGSVRISSGAASMAVNGFTQSPAALASIPNGGTTLSVGATLTIAPNQAPGNYSGSFPLTVNYQ